MKVSYSANFITNLLVGFIQDALQRATFDVHAVKEYWLVSLSELKWSSTCSFASFSGLLATEQKADKLFSKSSLFFLLC